VSERRVKLLYRTTCWTCDESVPAGTTIWWDDDRRHATCTECVPTEGPADAVDEVRPVDHRSRRRMEIIRTHTGHRPPKGRTRESLILSRI
jgi:hypothetical protein